MRPECHDSDELMDLVEECNVTQRRARVNKRWDQTDAALLALVRLILDDSWTAGRAAAELRTRIADDSVLRQLRARVRAAHTDPPTPLEQRAAQTVDRLFGPQHLTSDQAAV